MNNTLRLQRIGSLLSSNESLRWSGVPARGMRFRAVDALLVPFSLLWGGFAIFWETGVVHAHAPAFMQIWGIPFVLIGSYLIVGRFFFDAYLRAHTTYAVTDRAAYIVIDGLFPRTIVLTADALAPIELTQQSGSAGSIAFGTSHRVRSRNAGWTMWSPDTMQFASIENVASVYALVKEIA